MINNLRIPNIRLFVFGTLRVEGKLDYYMEGSSPLGLYYTQGQLMESANGSAYINFEDVGTGTIGELHHVNYYCLQRINHLEITWNEFPKRYDLSLIPVWSYQGQSVETLTYPDETKTMALCYKIREASKVESGDWINRKNVIEAVGNFLKEETVKTLYHNDVTSFVVDYLRV
jgi:gamma-glutamylcyclotransferase (GGCT)/AIG2-like uncharacterized protein YtfP